MLFLAHLKRILRLDWLRLEPGMRYLRSFGERIAARDRDRQTSEIHIRIELINRFNSLGIAEIMHAASRQRSKRKSDISLGECHNATPTAN